MLVNDEGQLMSKIIINKYSYIIFLMFRCCSVKNEIYNIIHEMKYLVDDEPKFKLNFDILIIWL